MSKLFLFIHVVYSLEIKLNPVACDDLITDSSVISNVPSRFGTCFDLRGDRFRAAGAEAGNRRNIIQDISTYQLEREKERVLTCLLTSGEVERERER